MLQPQTHQKATEIMNYFTQYCHLVGLFLLREVVLVVLLFSACYSLVSNYLNKCELLITSRK